MRLHSGLVSFLLMCIATFTAGGCAEAEWGAVETNVPDGPTWHVYNGHRYALTGGPDSWAAAQAEAASYGGSLVTIDNTEENDWLVRTFGAEWLWISLSQAPGAVEPADGWSWASGDVSLYRNWAPGQPDNQSGADNRAMVNVEGDLGQWHDTPAEGWPPDSPGKRGIMEVGRPGSGDADSDGGVYLD